MPRWPATSASPSPNSSRTRVSGSTALLAEAIHSLVDSTDQILLLIGEMRGRRPPDPDHPLGHGLESYFWSFVVAVVVLLLGGGVSLYQGVHHIMSPETIQSPLIGFAVLAVAAVFEGSTLAVSYREFKRVVRGRDVPLWTFIHISKDPSLYASLLEDSAALIGIAFAALGLLGSAVFHVRWADGAASLAIGGLLTVVAFVLANETRSLIAGEAVAPPVMEDIKRRLRADPRIEKVTDIATLHLGPKSVLVALTISFRSDMTLADLRQRDPRADGSAAADGRADRVRLRPAGAGFGEFVGWPIVGPAACAQGRATRVRSRRAWLPRRCARPRGTPAPESSSSAGRART